MAAYRWMLTNQHLQDINPLIAGQEQCAGGYRFGPNIRQYTLIHYVVSGKGVLHSGGVAYTVTAGEAFLILPGEVTTYEADADDPWYYQWVGFNGQLSRQFKKLPPVFSVPKEFFENIFKGAAKEAPEYHIAAGLLQLYALLFPYQPGINHHVQKVQDLIRTSYMQDLRVEDIARELNLDRRYLTRLFKEKTGMSIQQYLITVRMKEAKYCLEQGFNVKTTAQLCGYSDVSNFSKMYKRHYGHSPNSNN